MIQGICIEFHRTGNYDLCWDGVEDIPVFEDDKSCNVSYNLALAELLTHVNLNIWQPHFWYEVRRSHKISCRSPTWGCVIDDDSRLLPHQVHIQLKSHGQCHIINLWNFEDICFNMDVKRLISWRDEVLKRHLMRQKHSWLVFQFFYCLLSL